MGFAVGGSSMASWSFEEVRVSEALGRAAVPL